MILICQACGATNIVAGYYANESTGGRSEVRTPCVKCGRYLTVTTPVPTDKVDHNS